MFGNLDAFAEFLEANGYRPLHLYRLLDGRPSAHWQASTHKGDRFIWETATTAGEAMQNLAVNLGYFGSFEAHEYVNDLYKVILGV